MSRMFQIARGKNAQFSRAMVLRSTGPALVLSAAYVPENSAPGTTIGVAVPVNASNPGAVSIVSQTLANAIAMTGDGITFAVGAAGGATGTLNAEVTPTFQVTFAYTDDDGVHQFTRTITITDVADGPTIVGAATSLEAMVGAPQVGVQVSGDLDTLFVSPTSQAMTYTVSHGSIGVGNAWTWTPSAAGPTTVSVTAEDADGQTLQIDFAVDVAAAAPVNNAPVAGNVTLEFLVPPPAVGAPDAFTAGQWSVADAGTNGDATITITTLPANNGSAITALEYRLNGGAAVSLGGTTTGAYGISGLSDGTATNVQVRAVNTNGAGAWSDVKSVTATGVPAAFTAGQWSIADDTTGGDATLTITTLPSANGSAITDLERKIGAGAWTSLGAATTGTYPLANLFTDGVATDVLIRAVNANGNGGDSDTKSVTTTTAPASGISLVGWAVAAGNNDTNATLDLTALTGGSDTSPSPDDYVIVFGTASSGVDSDVTISDGTYGAIGTDIYQSDSFKINTNVFAKVQGGTPDTSVSINGSSNTTGGNSAVAVVLRGVDTTTPLDVAVQQAGSLNTALANAPQITPSTAGAWIIAGGGISQDLTPGTFTGPANMTDYHQATSVGSSRGNVTWAALKTDWSSGAFDPDALTGGDESTSYAFGAFTIAVRPA